MEETRKSELLDESSSLWNEQQEQVQKWQQKKEEKKYPFLVDEAKSSWAEQLEKQKKFLAEIEKYNENPIDIDQLLKDSKTKEIEYSYDLLLNILVTKSFVDLRIDKNYFILEYFWWEEKIRTKWFTFTKLYDDINEIIKKTWFNNEAKWEDFSFHIPITFDWKTFFQWFRWVLKESIDWNEITIRKLTTPRKISDSVKDKLLTKCVIDSLLSRKWFVISWKTWSWKTTTLISHLVFFNENDYSTIMLEEIEKIYSWLLYAIKSSKPNEFQESKKYLEKMYWSLENIEMIKKDLKFSFIWSQRFLYTKYSKKWEILPLIKLFQALDYYFKNQKEEKIEQWWKVFIELFKLNQQYIFDQIRKVENTEYIQSIKRFTQSRQRNIVTLEEPIEYIYWKDWILRFFQHSLSQHFNWKYERFIKQILRDNPSICYVWEVRTWEEIDVFLTSMSLWITSMTTCHSYNSFDTLNKFIDLSLKWKWEVLNILTNSFHSWMNIESYFFSSLKNYNHIVSWYIQWFDYLLMDNPSTVVQFRNSYVKWELSEFANKLRNWQRSWKWLAYIPKKYTLNYRLMVLFQQLTEKEKELQEAKFDTSIFIDEVSELLYNTNNFLESWDFWFFEIVYWKEITNKMKEHIYWLEQQQSYKEKKELLLSWNA